MNQTGSRILHAKNQMGKENQEPHKPDDAGITAWWFCDCKDTAIRWVNENRPHVAIAREGWFCMGCLSEFIQHNAHVEARPRCAPPQQDGF